LGAVHITIVVKRTGFRSAAFVAKCHKPCTAATCLLPRSLDFKEGFVLLKDKRKDLVEEWDFEKNIATSIDSVKATSNEKVSWICRDNPKHKWVTRIRLRAVENHGCHYCSGKKVLREDSLAAKHPDYLEEWDYEKNSGLDPWNIAEFSNKRAYWLCQIDPKHEWSTIISSRSRNASGCPHCARLNKAERIKGDRSLLKNFPDIAAEWNEDKNDNGISSVTYGSSKPVWWKCSKDSTHEWKSSPASRTGSGKRGCPYCSGSKVTENNSLASLYPEISKEWNHERNIPLTPETVKKASGRKVWWRCSQDPSHEWEAVIRNRTTLGSGCPTCDAEKKYIRLAHNQFGSSFKGTDYHVIFRSNISNIRKLMEQGEFQGTRLDQPFMRMLYASVITILETYLSDAFYELVIDSDEMVNRLFLNAQELNTKKYSVTEVIEWSSKKRDLAAEYMQKVVWHNLPKIASLYRCVLNIDIPLDNDRIHTAISMRHDLVHRNGKTKSGGSHRITKAGITQLVDEVNGFVELIDKQIDDVC